MQSDWPNVVRASGFCNQGKETRLRKRIKLLESKQDYHDNIRWYMLPKSLQKGFDPDLLKFLQK